MYLMYMPSSLKKRLAFDPESCVNQNQQSGLFNDKVYFVRDKAEDYEVYLGKRVRL